MNPDPGQWPLRADMRRTIPPSIISYRATQKIYYFQNVITFMVFSLVCGQRCSGDRFMRRVSELYRYLLLLQRRSDTEMQENT